MYHTVTLLSVLVCLSLRWQGHIYLGQVEYHGHQTLAINREELWQTMPRCFEFSFGKRTTVIIECFEVFTERPTNLLARCQTFSSYKCHNKVKVLIEITPQETIFLLCRRLGIGESNVWLVSNCKLLNFKQTFTWWFCDGRPGIHNPWKCGISKSWTSYTSSSQKPVGLNRREKYQGDC